MLEKIKGLILSIAFLVVLYYLDKQNILILRNIGMITLACLVPEWIKKSHSSEIFVDFLFAVLSTVIAVLLQYFADYLPLKWLYDIVVAKEFLFFFSGTISVLLAYYLSTPITLSLNKEKANE